VQLGLIEVLEEMPVIRQWFGIVHINKEEKPHVLNLMLSWKMQWHGRVIGRNADDWTGLYRSVSYMV